MEIEDFSVNPSYWEFLGVQRRRLVGGLSLAAGVLGVTIGVVTTSIREPKFDDRPLSFWLVELECVRTPVQRRN